MGVTHHCMLRHRTVAAQQLESGRHPLGLIGVHALASDFKGAFVEYTRTIATLVALSMLPVLCGSALSQEAPSAPVVLRGATMGAVRFPHSAHIRVAGRCEVCHHASKPEKPLKSAQQVCSECHTQPPTPPVSTSLQAAFHNPRATAGLCITCHKTENARGKAAPVKCADCHK